MWGCAPVVAGACRVVNGRTGRGFSSGPDRSDGSVIAGIVSVVGVASVVGAVFVVGVGSVVGAASVVSAIGRASAADVAG
jgi:hypothetical protein